MFTIDRGNFEGILASSLLISIILIRRKLFFWGAVCLGLCSSLKGYPIIFAYLFLKQKKYLHCVLSIAVAFTVTLSALALFEGGFDKNFDFLLKGSNFSHESIQQMLYRPDLVQRSISLFSMFKVTFLYLNLDIDLVRFLSFYKISAFICGIIIWFYILRKTKSFNALIASLTFMIMLFPYLSADYKLLHLFLPLILFFHDKQGKANKEDAYIVLLFCFLLIPKPYFYLKRVLSDSQFHDITLSIVLNPIAILVLWILLLKRYRETSDIITAA